MISNDEIMIEAEEALKKGEFQFYIQPKFHMQKRIIVGSEALLRWIDPETKKIKRYPDEFIPLFEKNDFITKVDCAIWERVCQWQKSQIDRGFKPLPCSINVSVMDFDNIDVAGTIISLKNKHNLPPECIEIELTETAQIKNVEKLKSGVFDLCSAGFKIQIDDFGTGYNDFDRLASIPFDTIKIPACYFENWDRVSDQKDINCIISIANEHGATVVAEGIQNEEQAKYLINNKCFVAQSYLYFKPMLPETFEQTLTKQRNNIQRCNNNIDLYRQ